MFRFVITLGIFFLSGSCALAQPQGFGQPFGYGGMPGPGPGGMGAGLNQRPTISPYLNLLRAGNTPGFNYYGLVRPQIQFQNATQNLQQQILTNQASIAGLNSGFVDQSVPTTGHTALFLNTGGYFLNPYGAGQQGGTGGMGGFGGVAGGARPLAGGGFRPGLGGTGVGGAGAGGTGARPRGY